MWLICDFCCVVIYEFVAIYVNLWMFKQNLHRENLGKNLEKNVGKNLAKYVCHIIVFWKIFYAKMPS